MRRKGAEIDGSLV